MNEILARIGNGAAILASGFFIILIVGIIFTILANLGNLVRGFYFTDDENELEPIDFMIGIVAFVAILFILYLLGGLL